MLRSVRYLSVIDRRVWSTDADQEAVGRSPQYKRRQWWSGDIIAQRLRRNHQRLPLHMHMRFGRRDIDNPDVSGKQFKQFLRFGR